MADRRVRPWVFAFSILLAIAGLSWWLGFGRVAPSGGPRQDPNDRIARAALPACPDAPPAHRAQPALELEVQLFLGAGVEPLRGLEVMSAARRYYAPYGVEITGGEARPLELESMFPATFAELEALAGDEAAVATALYAELRAFLRAEALPRRPGVVNVLVLRDVVHPSSAAASVLGDLVGLSLAPELLEAGDEQHAAVLEALDLGESFTPTVLLSERHLERQAAVAFVAAVAHELGHALGWVHVDPRWNLMSVGRHDCLPGLDDEQLARLGAR